MILTFKCWIKVPLLSTPPKLINTLLTLRTFQFASILCTRVIMEQANDSVSTCVSWQDGTVRLHSPRLHPAEKWSINRT